MAVTALLLATIYGALARGLLRDGVAPVVAVLIAILASGIGAVHFLVPPARLFTFAFFLWTLPARSPAPSTSRGGWAIGIVPVLMIVWANVHGGFLAGPVVVLTALLGHAVSGPWDVARRTNLGKFGLAFVLSCLTPLINPYGWGLYRHVGHLLVSSGVTELIDEYQPIPFGQGKARIVEWVVLALIALPSFSRNKLSRYDLAHTLIWLHFALGSIRHVPLFALAVAPALAQLLNGLPLAARDSFRCRSEWSPWPALAALAMTLAVGLGVQFGEFNPKTWPLETVPTLNRQPVEARLFHEQDWGGLIESECRPCRRAFLDDRFELFGKPAILQYLDALQGGPGWDALLGGERIDLVWLRPERGLAKRLAADPSWRELRRDDVSVLFGRVAGIDLARGQ